MNKQQAELYLERIGFTGPIRHDSDTLDRLIRAHLFHVPYEDLDVYEFGMIPSLHPDDLYDKIVLRRRGGYCYELNTSFLQLLVALGFPLYAAIIRLPRPGFPEAPHGHMGIVCTVEGRQWYCDVGIGGSGPRGVLEIREGEQEVYGTRFRGAFRGDEFVLDRLTEDGWTTTLYFTMRPAQPFEFEPLNFYAAGLPTSGFRTKRSVRMALPDGIKALSEKHYTVTSGDTVTERDVETIEEMEALLREEFGVVIRIPRGKPF